MKNDHLRLDKVIEVSVRQYKKPDGILGTDWHLFDDHVGINENVVLNDNGTFSTSVMPIGGLRVLCMNAQKYPMSGSEAGWGNDKIKYDIKEGFATGGIVEGKPSDHCAKLLLG